MAMPLPVASPAPSRFMQADPTMTPEQLLESIVQHVAALKSMLVLEAIEFKLRKELARPLLLLLQDELRTLDARLTKY